MYVCILGTLKSYNALGFVRMEGEKYFKSCGTPRTFSTEKPLNNADIIDCLKIFSFRTFSSEKPLNNKVMIDMYVLLPTK